MSDDSQTEDSNNSNSNIQEEFDSARMESLASIRTQYGEVIKDINQNAYYRVGTQVPGGSERSIVYSEPISGSELISRYKSDMRSAEKEVTTAYDEGYTNYMNYLEQEKVSPPSEEPVSDTPTRPVSAMSVIVDLVKRRIREGVSDVQHINPDTSYEKEEGEIISGETLRRYTVLDMLNDIKNITFYTPRTGMYIQKGSNYYSISRPLAYIYSGATEEKRKELYDFIGSKPSEGFVGPVYNPITSAYESLSDKEKEEYGFRYTDWSSIKPEDVKYYPGGLKYIEENKDKIVSRFLAEGDTTNPEYIDLISGRYGTYGTKKIGIYSDLSEGDRKRALVHDYLIYTDAERRKRYFESMPRPFQIIQSAGYGFLSGVTSPFALVQDLIKIGTGVQVGPSVSEFLYRINPGSPKDILSVGIEEGYSFFSGEKSHGAWERFKSDPLSGISATLGAIGGLYSFTKGVNIVNVSTIKGLGKVRGALLRKGIYTPSYAQFKYYSPTSFLRRGFTKLKAKPIENLTGVPYHSESTLTKSGLSFAKGSTPTSRIEWTTEKLIKSKSILPDDEFLVGSSSGGRIGRKFLIKPKALHELPSLSTAPYGYTPTRFYRFSAPSVSYSSRTSLLPKLNRPSAFAIPLKKIYKPITGSYDDIAKWAIEQPKGSWGMIGPKMLKGGPEAEINIFGRTVLKRYLPTESTSLLQRLKGYQYYATVPLEFGGREVTEYVPVVFTRAVGSGFPKGVSTIDKYVRKGITTLTSTSVQSEPSTSIFNLGLVGKFASYNPYEEYSYSTSIPIKDRFSKIHYEPSYSSYKGVPSYYGYKSKSETKPTTSYSMVSEPYSSTMYSGSYPKYGEYNYVSKVEEYSKDKEAKSYYTDYGLRQKIKLNEDFNYFNWRYSQKKWKVKPFSLSSNGGFNFAKKPQKRIKKAKTMFYNIKPLKVI